MSKQTRKIAPKFKRLYCPLDRGSIEALVAGSEQKTQVVVYEAYCLNQSCERKDRIFEIQAGTILAWMKKNEGKTYRPFAFCKDCFGKGRRAAVQPMPANVKIQPKPAPVTTFPKLSELEEKVASKEEPKPVAEKTESQPVFIRVKASVSSVFTRNPKKSAQPSPAQSAARAKPGAFFSSIKAKLSRPKTAPKAAPAPRVAKAQEPKKPGVWALHKTRMKFEGETVCLRFKAQVSFSSVDESWSTEEGICVAYSALGVTIVDKGAPLYEARTYAHEDIAQIALMKPQPESTPVPANLIPVTQ